MRGREKEISKEIASTLSQIQETVPMPNTRALTVSKHCLSSSNEKLAEHTPFILR